MNKQQLVKAMSINSNLTQDAARAALDAALLSITQALTKGDEVKIVDFGTFKAVKRAQRQGRNPKTGEPVMIPAATVPRFVAGKGLREAVN